MKPNKIIAITGGIGSGKSTVRQILEQKGYFCLDCDEINRELLTDPDYLSGLRSIFPEAFPNENLDKSAVKQMIFSDESKRAKLNAYAHRKIILKLLERINERKEKLVFVEIPLFSEIPTDFYTQFSAVWVVLSEDDIRAKRISARDSVSEDFARKQIAVQKDTKKCVLPMYYLENNGNERELRLAVETLLQIISK